VGLVTNVSVRRCCSAGSALQAIAHARGRIQQIARFGTTQVGLPSDKGTAHIGGNARWRAREGGDIACPVSAAG
jgi:hypothetical protein